MPVSGRVTTSGSAMESPARMQPIQISPWQIFRRELKAKIFLAMASALLPVGRDKMEAPAYQPLIFHMPLGTVAQDGAIEGIAFDGNITGLMDQSADIIHRLFLVLVAGAAFALGNIVPDNGTI